MSTYESLIKIEPAQTIVYYRGRCIAKDPGATGMKDLAYSKWVNDEVFLLQEKMSDGVFEYMAIGKIASPNMREVNKRKNYNAVLSRGD